MRDEQQYHHKVRVRVCGLLIEDDSILLAQIDSPVTGSLVWMPPGGGLKFGESIEDCLRREFLEETGLAIEINTLQFINELIEPPFHAVELYYSVEKSGGQKKTGRDPEHSADGQILRDIQWISLDEWSQYPTSPNRLDHYVRELSDS